MLACNLEYIPDCSLHFCIIGLHIYQYLEHALLKYARLFLKLFISIASTFYEV